MNLTQLQVGLLPGGRVFSEVDLQGSTGGRCRGPNSAPQFHYLESGDTLLADSWGCRELRQ